jgi:hypothetical protein
MKVQLESKIVNLIKPLEKDLTKVVHEALNLWLKKRLTVCPITNQFCINPNRPCNDCALTKKIVLNKE